MSKKRRTKTAPSGPAKRGAPYSKVVDPTVTASLFRSVQAGVPLRLAAAEAGIHPSTVFKWRAKGNEPEEPADSPYRLFALGYDRARAQRLRALLAAHDEHFPSSVAAVEFSLKNEFREFYGDVRTVRADVSSRVVEKSAKPAAEGGGLDAEDLAFLRDDILGLSD